MAVNTRDRRMSMIGLACPVPRVLPNPNGISITDFDSSDRQMLLFEYPGIANNPPPINTGEVGNLPRLNVG